MKPEAQRIAIAEFCGWTGITRTKGGSLNPNLLWWGYEPKTKANMAVPDYLNDLNAINEAEACLDINQRYVFGSRLYEVTDSWNPLTRQRDGWKEIHSTAAQRAEALLRTIGQWRDEP